MAVSEAESQAQDKTGALESIHDVSELIVPAGVE
jgi:hypothetical protein